MLLIFLIINYAPYLLWILENETSDMYNNPQVHNQKQY